MTATDYIPMTLAQLAAKLDERNESDPLTAESNCLGVARELHCRLREPGDHQAIDAMYKRAYRRAAYWQGYRHAKEKFGK